MAIQQIPGALWIPPAWSSPASLPTLSSVLGMNAAANWVAVVFRVPKTGTLEYFEWMQQTNTNPPDNGFRFSFQDVTATGNPDNVEDQYAVITSGFGAAAWLVPPNAMTNTGLAGGTKRAVTKGDWLACVVRLENYVASDSVGMAYLNLAGGYAAEYSELLRYLLTTTNSGTAWTKVNGFGLPAFALKYDDGTYAELGWPWLSVKAINQRDFANASTPDERGLLFQLPFPARISGMWVRVDLEAACSFILYDAANTILASITLDSGRRVTTVSANARIDFVTPVDLSANVNYRITVLPTTASNVTIYDYDLPSSAYLLSSEGGSTWMSTQRTNAGAWTNVNTNKPFMGLILNGFDSGGGGAGGGEHSYTF